MFVSPKDLAIKKRREYESIVKFITSISCNIRQEFISQGLSIDLLLYLMCPQ